MKYNRDINEIEAMASLWWPANLTNANADISIIPNLIKTQDEFLSILNLSKKTPFHIFEVLSAARFPANLFLKHLCVLADYGGEPIQRLGRSFSDIFEEKKITFTWNEEEAEYTFQALPLKGLGNKKLFIDGQGLQQEKELNPLYMDLIILLLFGSVSTASEHAGLSSCEIGTLLGDPAILKQYVKERYIVVSRITGGATANSLGQLAQTEIFDYLLNSLGTSYKVVRNGNIYLDGYEKGNMPFDIVVENKTSKIGIEVSFQVTTNSTIERKAGQSADRLNLMHRNGYKIAYVIDGAGNFQRKSAVSAICNNSDCTVAYSVNEFEVLVSWIKEICD